MKALPQLFASTNLDVPSAAWLIFVLSKYECFNDVIFECQLNTWSLNELEKQLLEERKVVIMVPLIRCIANICATSDECLLLYASSPDFPNVVKELLNSSYESLQKETFLMVANIVNNPRPEVRMHPAVLSFKVGCERLMERVFTLF